MKREYFQPFSLKMLVNFDPKINQELWIYKYSYFPFTHGKDCCSRYPMTFHYMIPDDIYIMHGLLYYVQIFKKSKYN